MPTAQELKDKGIRIDRRRDPREVQEAINTMDESGLFKLVRTPITTRHKGIISRVLVAVANALKNDNRHDIDAAINAGKQGLDRNGDY
jgi:hypothetical protein